MTSWLPIILTKEIKMAKLKEVGLVVTNINDTDVTMRFGGFSVTTTLDELFCIDNTPSLPDAVLNNAKVNIAVTGVNRTDLLGIKAALESRTYKHLE